MGVSPIIIVMRLTDSNSVLDTVADELSPLNSALCKLPPSIRRNVEVTPSGCWLWRGVQFTTGYGAFKFDGRLWKAHRLVWTLLNGPIPPGIHCLHHCDTPLCVNAFDTKHHIFLGTNRDNHQDKAAKGRHWQQQKTHCPQGHPYLPENTYRPPSGGRKCKICIASRRSK